MSRSGYSEFTIAAEAFSVLWDWQCLTHTGSVFIPQRLHDGTFRQYASTVAGALVCGTGKDALTCAVDLAMKLGWTPPCVTEAHPAETQETNGADASEWVAVEEAFPEPGQWVLCWRSGHHMRMFQHTGFGWRKEDGSIPRHTLEYTHWRPLPEGPRTP